MSQHTIENRRLASWRRVAGLSALCVLLVSFAIAGCSGGSSSDDSGDDSTEKADAAREAALESQQEAKDAGCEKYAPKEWAKAVKAFEKADSKYDDGATTSKYFTASKNGFRKAIRSAEKGKDKYSKAEEAKNEYLAVKKKAKEAKIDETYPEDWKQAEGYFKKGEDMLSAAATFSKAKTQFRFAKSQLEDKLERLQIDQKSMAKALDAKKDMEEFKQKASTAGADQSSISNFEMGRKSEKEANDLYADGRYDQAVWSYNGAKDWFVAAIEEAAAIQAAKAYEDEINSRPERGADDSMEAPDLDDIDVPDLDDDAEDGGYDTDIASNLDKLFHTECDYSGGVIKLSYPFGVDFRKDVTAYGVRTQGKHRTLIFEGSEGVGVYSGEKPSEEELDEVDPEDISSYTFAANTRGAMVVNAGFKDGMQIEFDIRYQLVLADQPLFRAMVNSSKNCKDFLGTDFGCWVVVGENKRAMKRDRHPDKLYKWSPQNWIDRKRDYHFKLIYRKDSEEEKGTFAIFMDDEEMFRRRMDKYRKGFPGFQWNNVKFFVRNLKLKGRLDEEWAVERLKELKDIPPEVEEEDLDF